MGHANELPALAEQPEDGRHGWAEHRDRADEFVYRLGLTALPVPGLPPEVVIDDVTARFVQGPVRAQRTVMRQRHSLPFHFDKQMSREWVGHGDLITQLELSSTDPPEDLDLAISAWRQRVLAAAGLLAAVLDERLVGEELFEDVLLLNAGAFVGAIDMRRRVRTFLPFEVNASDRASLERLTSFSLDESSDAARAARLYRRAANEGPTADAYALLWMAAECFSDHDSPSRKDIEAALDGAGIDPDSLPIHVGLLIDLRGKVQHRGTEEHERLRTAFYEMEAIVRCLIRQHSEIDGGWWVAADHPSAFVSPLDEVVASQLGPGETTWHHEALPPVTAPAPLRIPRRVLNADRDPRINVVGAHGARDLIVRAVVDAMEWVNPDGCLDVVLGRPDHVPEDSMSGADARAIWIASERLEGWDDPARPQILVSLVWDLYGLVGYAAAQSAGMISQGDGVVVVEAVGAWLQYTCLVTYGEFDPDILPRPSSEEPKALGTVAGWAAAGDPHAQASIEGLSRRSANLARDVCQMLREHPPSPAVALIDRGPTSI